jgi:hypothetical protein
VAKVAGERADDADMGVAEIVLMAALGEFGLAVLVGTLLKRSHA